MSVTKILFLTSNWSLEGTKSRDMSQYESFLMSSPPLLLMCYTVHVPIELTAVSARQFVQGRYGRKDKTPAERAFVPPADGGNVEGWWSLQKKFHLWSMWGWANNIMLNCLHEPLLLFQWVTVYLWPHYRNMSHLLVPSSVSRQEKSYLPIIESFPKFLVVSYLIWDSLELSTQFFNQHSSCHVCVCLECTWDCLFPWQQQLFHFTSLVTG